MDQLLNKVAIVTGASSGIGRATAKLFAQEGAKLIVAARREDKLNTLVEEISDTGGESRALAGADEYGAHGIKVNALLPGGTDTPMADEHMDQVFENKSEAIEFIQNIHTLKRIATPIEIAKPALYLASGVSSFTTGSAMLADGGVSISKV